MTIQHISDTAKWVAVYRAMETERPDAIFRDPYARRLAGIEGEEIVNVVPRGRSMAWAMIVRTVLFDELITECIRDRGITTVLNLAAGLDARPWRMDLPVDLRWVDADLPGILDYKASIIGDDPPRCRYEAQPTDLTDPEARRRLLSEMDGGPSSTLVLTEGLLIYLSREQVGALSADLHADPAVGWWIIDLANPMLLRYMNSSQPDTAERGDVRFRFAPEEGPAFFEPFGWKEARFLPTVVEARRLKREMKLMWLWRILGLLTSRERRREARRMSGTVLLESFRD